jgi:hypothetical protein
MRNCASGNLEIPGLRFAHPEMTYGHFFTVFAAGAFAGACGYFGAAGLMSSISFETRAALLPRSLSK